VKLLEARRVRGQFSCSQDKGARLRILPSSVISYSVMSSAKYSSSGLPERFSRGSTASDWIGVAWARPTGRFFPHSLKLSHSLELSQFGAYIYSPATRLLVK